MAALDSDKASRLRYSILILPRKNMSTSSAAALACQSSPDRHKDDFYATPRSAIEQLLDVERFDGPIWEPACGDGAISKVLQERGHSVVSTDLVDRGFGLGGVDFTLEQSALAPNVVTNPPFKLATMFARKALELSPKKVALLLKIGFLEGPTRSDLFDAAPLARIWVIRRRVSFLRGGTEAVSMNGKGGMVAYAWFVWDKDHSGPPTIGWLEGEPCK